MGIDIDKFAVHLRTNARAQSQGKCARWVRQALEAAGAKTTGSPVYAKDWGTTLAGNPAGHIAVFDGKNWISDFIQRDIRSGPGYRKEKPSYAVYRP